MTGTIRTILSDIAPPATAGVFNVVRIPGTAAYYAGRNSQGTAAMLVRTTDQRRTVPLQLAGIEARFAIPCRVSEIGQDERLETFTAIICLSQEPVVETYFAGVFELLVDALSPAPNLEEIREVVERLIELFQKLRDPPRKSVLGIVGELLFINAARNPADAIKAWRVDPTEHFDFAVENLRLDAKATSGPNRVHELSFGQATPPDGCIGILASILVTPSGGGTTLSDLLALIEARLDDHPSLLKLRTVVADTLGRDLLMALRWRFDLHQARSSILLVDLRSIPAIRGALPMGVSRVRFASDLAGCPAVAASTLSALDLASRAILPV